MNSARLIQRSLLVVGLISLAWLPPAVAQEDLEGLPIRDIVFEGLRLLPEDSAAFYLGIAEGKPLDWNSINANMHQLWERRLVDDIQVEAEPLGDGVRLTVRLVERPTLAEIEYKGLKRISKTDIQEAISREQIRVLEGDSLDLGELYRLGAAIEQLYEEKGYRLARVQYTLRETEPGEHSVVFTIDEGDKVKIEQISFDGNTVMSDGRLRRAMDETKESGLIASIRKRDVYNAVKLEEDLELVGNVYREKGYKNIVLGEPELDIRPVKGEGSKRKLFVTVPIQEGSRWKWGETRIEGNETYPDELLIRQFDKPSGGWLRSNVIDDGVEGVGKIYANTGYVFADVSVETVEREDYVADVVVHVDEGDQYRVGRIEFEGNRRTRDKVLRRELGIQEGYLLNQGALRNSLLRIRQLEFFDIDEDDPVAFDFDDEEKEVDLLLKGEEGERTELQFGAGFSEIDGFFGQFSYRTRNFMGRGETLGLTAQTGRYRDIFQLSYDMPWFLDRPQSIGINLFLNEQDFSLLSGQEYQQESIGGSFTYGRNLGLFGGYSITYSRFDTKESRTLRAVDGSLIRQDFERDVSSLRLGYNFDRRDSRLNPTQGHRYASTVEVAGGPIGGSQSYVRLTGIATYYKPIGRSRIQQVFAVNSSAGYIAAYEDQDLFPFDRYYSGGENSIRGFRYRSIWVRDPDTGATIIDESGFPVGGDKLFVLNLEYHFVINETFRLLLWTDAGNVYSEFQDYDLTNLRHSAGLEFRVTVPLFGAPLRFIWANNLDPIDDVALGADRFESFQFSISTSF